MDKILLKIFLIFSVFLLALIISASYYKKKQKKEIYKKDRYKAVIVNKYIQKNRHGNPVIDVADKKDTSSISVHSWPYLWKHTEIGDSLIKPPDTLSLKVKKRAGDQITIEYKNESNSFLVYLWFFIFFALILSYIIKPNENKLNK